MVILNLLNLNGCQLRIIFKNLTNLAGNTANLALVNSTQMERANEMINLINGDITLASQSSINIFAKILKLGNKTVYRKRVRYSEFNFQSARHAIVDG